MAHKYDLAILGAGPACGPAARAAKDAGKSVAVIEERYFGGVCPMTGCNPKKVLMAAAEAVHAAETLRGKGLASAPGVDWAALMRFKREFTEPIPDAVENGYWERGIDTFHGHAAFVSEREVEVEGEIIEAERFLVATGARPRTLTFPGADLVSSSDDFLDMDALPGRIILLGGGFISFEFAGIAARCGAKAVIATHGDRALRAFDPDMVDVLVGAMRSDGIDVHFDAPVVSVEKRGAGLVLTAGKNGGITLHADMIVNGAGRVPNVDLIGLDKAGVEAGKRGVKVNAFLQSVSNENVYAAGDVADTPFALTPTADIESAAVGKNLVHGNVERVDYTGVPSVAFSLPPLAAVGASEAELRERGIKYVKKENNLAEWFSWKRLGETRGAVKILMDEKKERILGAHMVGHEAGELINYFAMAVRLGLPLGEMRKTVWSYPTSSYYIKYMI